MTDTEQKALEVLKRAYDSTLQEMARCGDAGGIGRANTFAPIFVNICNAMEKLEAKREPSEETTEVKRGPGRPAVK